MGERKPGKTEESSHNLFENISRERGWVGGLFCKAAEQTGI